MVHKKLEPPSSPPELDCFVCLWTFTAHYVLRLLSPAAEEESEGEEVRAAANTAALEEPIPQLAPLLQMASAPPPTR